MNEKTKRLCRLGCSALPVMLNVLIEKIKEKNRKKPYIHIPAHFLQKCRNNVDVYTLSESISSSGFMSHSLLFPMYLLLRYNSSAFLQVCDLSEDHACRNLAAANNILDHTSYFGINADDYLKQQCKKDLLN